MRKTRRTNRRTVGLNMVNPTGPNRKTRRWWNTADGKQALKSTQTKSKLKTLIKKMFQK
jgi:hypothetical protein